jgi:hypothetical protein
MQNEIVIVRAKSLPDGNLHRKKEIWNFEIISSKHAKNIHGDLLLLSITKQLLHAWIVLFFQVDQDINGVSSDTIAAIRYQVKFGK